MILSPTASDLEEIVATFESAARNGRADIAKFLPSSDSALYAPVLRELVRVDMELGWSSGQSPRVEEYLRQFPQLRSDPESLSEICFEEYRLRKSKGENVDPVVYNKQFHVDTKHWPIEQSAADALAQRATDYLKGSTILPGAKNGPSVSVDAPTQLFVELHNTDEKAAHSLAQALTSFPNLGDSFMGFDLVDELGRGAFSRVYLAQERAVDGRRVALKITGDMRSEVRALARLRHTNIAPVYSVRASDPFHAVCMPFCGSITLAHVIRMIAADKVLPKSGSAMTRLVGRTKDQPDASLLTQIEVKSYVDAVLAMATRLAEGLAHAHDRGICHRDIKPANVLLADDGEPLLLDFNLATEMSIDSSATAAFIGGTLPYMAPEQLKAFCGSAPPANCASDVYSFGLLLYEWLTGRLPHPLIAGPVDDIVNHLIVERSSGINDIRTHNPDVTPSFAAIIAKCLKPNPTNRFSSARDLAGELARQRDHLPLHFVAEPSWKERVRKWSKRHPYLSSGFTVSLLSAVLIVGLTLGTWSIYRDREAFVRSENRRNFLSEYQVARINLAHPHPDVDTLRRGLTAANNAWQRFPETSPEFRKERGILAHMLAKSVGRAQESDEKVLRQREIEAKHWSDQAHRLLGADLNIDTEYERWKRDGEFQQGALWLLNRPPSEALAVLVEETKRDANSAQSWYLRGLNEKLLSMPNAAFSSFTTSIAIDNTLPESFHFRAVTAMELGKYRDAIADLEMTLRLDPLSISPLVDRGICKLELNDLVGAEADLSDAIQKGYPETRLYFLRARVRDRLNKNDQAKEDRAEGMRRVPVSDADWSARALARLPGDPKAALADLEECLKQYPKSVLALHNRAYIFDELVRQPVDAISALDDAIRLDPSNGKLLASRGVLLARQGQFAKARTDAVQALQNCRFRSYPEILDPRPDVIYQVAGIYALTAIDRPADRETALYLLNRAVHLGFGADLVEIDPDLKSVQQLPEVKRMVSTAKKFKNVGGLPD